MLEGQHRPTVPSGNFSALLHRAQRLDAQSLLRIREREDRPAQAFLTTPFEALLAIDVPPALPLEQGVIGVGDLLAGRLVQRQAQWPGALPPSEGFSLLDEVPGEVVAQLAEDGRTLARAHSGPLGVPPSLLDQTVLNVEGREVPMRVIFACDVYGLIPPAASSAPRQVRVSAAGRWLRVDTVVASAYFSRGLPLL
ncbi:hypothetical protein [Corynebacterium pseudopelargi]|uniref:DUF8185 domain-containing protein n=1 Tax=Corynebacterium pseudopelargi TaxID=2080757 RepID=A0A3G6ISN5_9CORY|nr:hypothetical protein [Corynebacterium pseudopelargi]AZA08651.1 hypothetical protein CPPEL_02590 [Corynebacterium pseudopelargi]